MKRNSRIKIDVSIQLSDGHDPVNNAVENGAGNYQGDIQLSTEQYEVIVNNKPLLRFQKFDSSVWSKAPLITLLEKVIDYRIFDCFYLPQNNRTKRFIS